MRGKVPLRSDPIDEEEDDEDEEEDAEVCDEDENALEGNDDEDPELCSTRGDVGGHGGGWGVVTSPAGISSQGFEMSSNASSHLPP